MGTTEWVFILILIILPIAALFDLMKDKTVEKNKIVWAATIIFFPLIGPFIYLVVTRTNFFTKKDHDS